MFLRHCVTDFYKPRCHLQQGKNNKNKSVKLGGWRGEGGVSQKIQSFLFFLTRQGLDIEGNLKKNCYAFPTHFLELFCMINSSK